MGNYADSIRRRPSKKTKPDSGAPAKTQPNKAAPAPAAAKTEPAKAKPVTQAPPKAVSDSIRVTQYIVQSYEYPVGPPGAPSDILWTSLKEIAAKISTEVGFDTGTDTSKANKNLLSSVVGRMSSNEYDEEQLKAACVEISTKWNQAASADNAEGFSSNIEGPQFTVDVLGHTRPFPYSDFIQLLPRYTVFGWTQKGAEATPENYENLQYYANFILTYLRRNQFNNVPDFNSAKASPDSAAEAVEKAFDEIVKGMQITRLQNPRAFSEDMIESMNGAFRAYVQRIISLGISPLPPPKTTSQSGITIWDYVSDDVPYEKAELTKSVRFKLQGYPEQIKIFQDVLASQDPKAKANFLALLRRSSPKFDQTFDPSGNLLDTAKAEDVVNIISLNSESAQKAILKRRSAAFPLAIQKTADAGSEGFFQKLFNMAMSGSFDDAAQKDVAEELKSALGKLATLTDSEPETIVADLDKEIGPVEPDATPFSLLKQLGVSLPSVTARVEDGRMTKTAGYEDATPEALMEILNLMKGVYGRGEKLHKDQPEIANWLAKHNMPADDKNASGYRAIRKLYDSAKSGNANVNISNIANLAKSEPYRKEHSSGILSTLEDLFWNQDPKHKIGKIKKMTMIAGLLGTVFKSFLKLGLLVGVVGGVGYAGKKIWDYFHSDEPAQKTESADGEKKEDSGILKDTKPDSSNKDEYPKIKPGSFSDLVEQNFRNHGVGAK